MYLHTNPFNIPCMPSFLSYRVKTSVIFSGLKECNVHRFRTQDRHIIIFNLYAISSSQLLSVAMLNNVTSMRRLACNTESVELGKIPVEGKF
jgi:hypothetical protein